MTLYKKFLKIVFFTIFIPFAAYTQGTPRVYNPNPNPTICAGSDVMFIYEGGCLGSITWEIGGGGTLVNSTSTTATIRWNTAVTNAYVNARCNNPLSQTATTGNFDVISSSLIPAVTISGPITVYNGAATYTATPVNGGTAPIYYWKVNGVIKQSALSATYNATQLVNGDVVSVQMSSNIPCIASPTANSNTITVSVITFNPLNNYNYIKETTVQKDGQVLPSAVEALPLGDKLIKWDYFDGLGRPMQSIGVQASPNQKDVVQPIVYDAFGRETIKYLPYVSTENNGYYKANAVSVSGNYTGSPQYNFYNNGTSDKIADDLKPYAETRVEPSPMARVLAQGAPGATWQPNPASTYVNPVSSDRTVKMAYETNIANEVLLWTYSYATNPYHLGLVNASNGATPIYYAAGELVKNRTKDEHHNEVIEYIDKHGKVILKKVQSSPLEYAQTYYIYDDMGNLVCVLQPEGVRLIVKTPSDYFNQTDAVKETFLDQWAFRYIYDDRGRMTIKQVPGAGPVYMVYDKRDRLVMTQDSVQRGKTIKEWLFTKYDVLNRPVLTGMIKTGTASLTQAAMQASVNNYYDALGTNNGAWYEEFTTAAGNVHGYTNKSYPLTDTLQNYLTVTYYDNYNFKTLFSSGVNGWYEFQPGHLPVDGTNPGQEATSFNRTTGQVTGMKVKILGDAATWLKTVNYYDDNYRAIQQITENRKGYEVTTNVYDFVGKVLRTKTTLYTGQPVQWASLVGAQVDGETVTSTSATLWGSGASSAQTLPANTDGWVEHTIVDTNPRYMFGLADSDASVHYNTIDYALYVTAGSIRAYENGAAKGSTVNAYPGDVLRIERVGNKVYYKRNGEVIYTSLTSSTSVLLADISFSGTGAKLTKGRLSNTFSVSAPYAYTGEVLKRFTYDHVGRLIETWHQLNGGTPILLSKNEYNELGQLVDKKLHSTVSAGPFKQSVDYRYNIRGWLTSINNSALDVLANNDDANDLFGMDLGYNEDLGTGVNNIDLTTGLVSHYSFTGNANDAGSAQLNGTVSNATLTTDAQGNANQAYAFASNSYIDIPNSKPVHSFIQNTGKFTITAMIKITDLAARSVIVSSTNTTSSKGFSFMYETFGGTYGDHQLRFSTSNGSTSFVAKGEYMFTDNNWHHVAVVGDGKFVQFYVDGLPDGQPVAMTLFSTGDASYTTLIGKTRTTGGAMTLSMSGSLDEIKVFNRNLNDTEIGALAKGTSSVDLKQYNGNISVIKWSKNLGLGDVKELAYNFKYDAMNRLTEATSVQSSAPAVWTKGQFDEAGLKYDLNGNIKMLQRRGEGDVLIDYLTYNYGAGGAASNKLLGVADVVTNSVDKAKGFVDGYTGTDYTYDANGNMTTDRNKGLGTAAITYYHLNLPQQITKDNTIVNYWYDATGRKIGQVAKYGTVQKVTEYIGQWIFENNELQFVQHEEGRIVVVNHETKFAVSCESVSEITPTSSVTAITETKSDGETYIQVSIAAGVSKMKEGVMKGPFAVQPGERYKLKAKGWKYYQPVSFFVQGNPNGGSPSDLVWPGSNFADETEIEMEQTFTIPVGVNEIAVGLVWNTTQTTQGDHFYLNSFELIKIGSAAPEYQYHLKDHLGNVRLTFTTKQEQEVFTATLEDNTQANEQNKFRNYSRNDFDLFDHTDAGTTYHYSQLLNGGNNSQIGLAKTLAVMPGDTIKAEVYAKYRNLTSNPGSLSVFASALTSAFGLSSTGTGEAAQAYSALNAYGALIAGGYNHSDEETAPKAYLNILLFDKNHNLVDASYKQIGEDDDQIDPLVKEPHGYLNREIVVGEPGYAYIFLSNENPFQVDVYFDDLKITHVKSPVVQMDDYYPFGLTFNSWRRANVTGNQYLYNGKEKRDELDLGWFDYQARQYDPAIGRFLSVDPATALMRRYSPYAYAFDNPVRFIDPDGMVPDDTTPYDPRKGKPQPFINTTHKSTGPGREIDTDYSVDSDLVNRANRDNHDLRGGAGGKGTGIKRTDPKKRYKKFKPVEIPRNPYQPLRDPVKAILWTFGQAGYAIYNVAGTVADDPALSILPGPQTVEITGVKVALGVSEYLDDFARLINGKTWKTWGNKDFSSQFLETISNPNNKIHFNLDGVDDVMKAVTEGSKGLNNSRVTSWELYQLYSNPEALKRTTFYSNGKVVKNPFLE